MSDKKMPSYDQIMEALPLIQRKLWEKEMRGDIPYHVINGLVIGASIAGGAVLGPVVLTGFSVALLCKRWRDRPSKK